MSDRTPLDDAHAGMDADSDDARARLTFFSRLAAAELHLWLEREADGPEVTPRLFPVEEATFAVAFDREDRLAAFAEGPAPHATLSGRRIARLLSEAQLGLALNLGAPSEILLPPGAMAWLAEATASEPARASGRAVEFRPPRDVPEALLVSIDARLAAAEGLAVRAWLAAVTYDDDQRSHLLAFEGALAGAEEALSRAVAEAVAFSGLDAAAIDVTVLPDGAPPPESLARVALRFDLPRAERGSGPGFDPSKPPRLR